MNKNPKLNNFVSEIDQFLNRLTQENSLTTSQLTEKAKNDRIQLIRDETTSPKTTPNIWDKF
jgi:hypothetical protein